MGGTKTIRLVIDSDLESVSLVGRAVNHLARLAGFSEQDASQIELCVFEAANNSIRHAYLRRKGHEVEVAFTIDTDRVLIEVSDTGTPMGELKEAKLEFDPEDPETLPEGGMGLYIMQSVMDDISYASDSGRNTLRMTKRLIPSPSPAG